MHSGADANASASALVVLFCSLQPSIVYLVFELVHLDQHGANAMLVPMLVVLVLFCSLQTSRHQMCFLHTASVEYSVVDSDLENIQGVFF